MTELSLILWPTLLWFVIVVVVVVVVVVGCCSRLTTLSFPL